ncbi:glycosyltransferase family 2 protein [Clostridioides sp. ZZV14-6345]|uniref:glycosyltransferase family 2 protein n=1 Tax=Clostridioides sp. ZZV14-6345 TaxID=2811496 RepID=UPI001D102214|nr:glycosyltransferase family 2 protein [Clostridioides sp. ZZV14-6345]
MVDIIIPNYNGSKYLKKCIESILKQKYSKFRIIIIDNNSTDDIYNIIKNYKNLIFKKLDKNYGFSKAVNEGIKLSKSDYVVLLNNDTEIKDDWLEKMLAKIKSDEKIFSVCSKMIKYNDKTLIDDAGDEYTLFSWTIKRGDGKKINRFNRDKSVFSSCAGAAIYRKDILEEIGYFDETFFAYMEDVDICYRAKINGYKNMYCADAQVYHVGSATSGSKYNSFKVKLSARNNVYVIYKNLPFFQILINGLFILMGFLIKYIFFSKKGYGKEYKKGFIEGIKTLKNVEKNTFKFKNMLNYIKIEYLLIINMFKYILSIIF